MIRLFVDSDLSAQQKIVLPVKQAHYLTHVMRLKSDEEVEIFNGRQGVWRALLKQEKKQTTLICQEQIQQQIALKPCILCPALIKKEHMDMVLQKATELGATEIYPIVAERSVMHTLNMERAQSIICEACEQCERVDVPVLHTPQKLSQILDELKEKTHLIWLSERGQTHKTHSDLPPALFVGPEGGWTDDEVELLEQHGFARYSLGPRILRTDTAVIALLARLMDIG